MNKRKFLKVGIFGSLIGYIGLASSKNIFSSSEFKLLNEDEKLEKMSELAKNPAYVAFDKKQYNVVIKNIHTQYFNKSSDIFIKINSRNLFSFSLEQGEYAIQMLPRDNGFVEMLLFELNKKQDAYEKIGYNKINTEYSKKSEVSWLSEGINIRVY